MPFTVAHAVVAPPLSRLTGGRLAASALAVGAMSPDFEYVAYLQTRRTIGHTPLGLVVLCLPASLAVLAVWHFLVKRPLAGLLPTRWAHLGAAVCRPLPPATWRRAAAVAGAILLGGLTHIVWDSFTHADGLAVGHLEALRRPVVAGLPLYQCLQYGSGLAGMALLALAVLVWARSQPPAAVAMPPVRRRVAGAAFLTTATLAGAAANAGRMAAAGGTRHDLVVAAALGAMAAGAVSLLAYGTASGGRGPVLAEPG